MCKCEKTNKENVEVMAVDLGELLAMVVCDIIDDIVGEDGETTEEIGRNIDLEKEIDKVVFSDPATIVFWKDGTKTVTKCSKGDTFNKETGLAMCIIRKLCNNKHYNHVFEKFCN